ncbi:MAG: hypothetical protein NC489_25050 [Ruminococcus flavefaciens]|nr:hypothetical protein [Ruminococcus flavefaciens]
MKKLKKKKVILVFVLALVLGYVIMPLHEVKAAGVDLSAAESITMGTTMNGAITEDERAQVYSFSIESAGRITFDMESHMQYYSIIIYDMSGEIAWYTDHNEWNSNLKYVKNTHTADLIGGSYYLRVTGYYNVYGDYSSTGTFILSTNFISAGESMEEPNNEFTQASTISVNGSINGQIAANDPQDIYTFLVAKSGRLKLNITSYMRYYTIILYDSMGELIWYTDCNEWNSNLCYRTDEHLLDVSAANYYLRVTGNYYYHSNIYSSTGNYIMNLSFTESGESITEPNNDFTSAYPLALGKTVKGQIALDDSYDICKFSLSKSTDLGITITSYMKYYSLEIDDANGKKIAETNWNEWNENVGYRTDNLQAALSAGIYYLKIYANNNATGTYTLCLGDLPSVREASVAKIKNRTYKSAYIEPAVKVTYKGKVLKRGTDYTLSYRDNYYVGKATVVITGIGKYTGTKEVNFKIVPKAPKITTAKNSGKGTGYLIWDEIYGADGYEIYYSTREKSGYKLRYRSSNGAYNVLTMYKLKKGKKYYFKVRAYQVIDGKKYYSSFSKPKAIKIKK